MNTLIKSYNNTIHAANELFISEGPQHDLYVAPFGYQDEYALKSTSGTTFRTGSRDECNARLDDLLLYALTGYESLA